jgi:Zn ribbon nucleic-acid-binding protein
VRCPKCSDARSRVSETKFYKEGVRRRRECKACGHRYSTDEHRVGDKKPNPLHSLPPERTVESMESLAIKWINKVMDERDGEE